MRHASAPNNTAAHFATRSLQVQQRKRKVQTQPASVTVTVLSPQKLVEGLAMSFEEITSPKGRPAKFHRDTAPIPQRSSSTSSVSSMQSADSFTTSRSQPSPPPELTEQQSPVPSMSVGSGSTSFVNTPLPTPSSSRAPSLNQPGLPVNTTDNGLGLCTGPPVQSPPAARGWVPNFGKMAKAVVNAGLVFGDKKVKPVPPVIPFGSPSDMYDPDCRIPRPTREELEVLSPEAAMQRRREWASAQQQRVAECARLCSQWPQSGYNLSKWGQYGMSRGFSHMPFADVIQAHVRSTSPSLTPTLTMLRL